MRTPYSYGFPGDVSYSPQNRVKELYYGNAPNGRMERSMQSLPSGSHMAPIGKTVLRGRGMGALVAVPLEQVTGRPVMRAAYEAARLGVASPIQMAALGDAVADRAACQATTGAMVGGAGVAQQMHTQSGGTDQGWTTGIGVFSALAQTASSMCALIQTGGAVSSAPAGTTPPPLSAAATAVPPALPPSTRTAYLSVSSSSAPSSDFMAGIPSWAILAGAAVVGGLVASVAFGK